MTGPDLVEIITQALATSEKQMHTNESLGKQRMQARAVLAALLESGGVEWGVRWDRLSDAYPERTDRKDSRELAQAALDKSFATGSVVLRVSGVWVEVE